jgi:hypothetical protein
MRVWHGVYCLFQQRALRSVHQRVTEGRLPKHGPCRADADAAVKLPRGWPRRQTSRRSQLEYCRALHALAQCGDAAIVTAKTFVE